jgi:hypothetical protein
VNRGAVTLEGRPARAVVVKGFHNSGRFDRSDELLEKNVRRMRTDGRTFGTRTEMSSREFADELHWPKDGWEHFHPRTEFGLANCSLEWSSATWRLLDQDVLPLTDIRITTKGGFLLPPSQAPWVVLEHRRTGLEVELMTGHMNLHNTAKRHAAWLDEADTLRKHWNRSKRRHPDRVRIYQADINRTQRLKSNQLLVQRTMLRGTGMKNMWIGDIPARGGTHGKRAILDAAFADVPGKIYLLGDDASSDHRPFGVEYNLAA